MEKAFYNPTRDVEWKKMIKKEWHTAAASFPCEVEEKEGKPCRLNEATFLAFPKSHTKYITFPITVVVHDKVHFLRRMMKLTFDCLVLWRRR